MTNEELLVAAPLKSWKQVLGQFDKGLAALQDESAPESRRPRQKSHLLPPRPPHRRSRSPAPHALHWRPPAPRARRGLHQRSRRRPRRSRLRRRPPQGLVRINGALRPPWNASPPRTGSANTAPRLRRRLRPGSHAQSPPPSSSAAPTTSPSTPAKSSWRNKFYCCPPEREAEGSAVAFDDQLAAPSGTL